MEDRWVVPLLAQPASLKWRAFFLAKTRTSLEDVRVFRHRARIVTGPFQMVDRRLGVFVLGGNFAGSHKAGRIPRPSYVVQLTRLQRLGCSIRCRWATVDVKDVRITYCWKRADTLEHAAMVSNHGLGQERRMEMRGVQSR